MENPQKYVTICHEREKTVTTHRSLNKLEFKAHMSIHNFVDVPEEQTLGASFTRDRFGKNHSLKNEDGSLKLDCSRLKVKVLSAFAFFFMISCAAVLASEGSLKNTNVTIDSEDDSDSTWNKKFNGGEEKFGFNVDSSTSVGFNEDGDPSMSRRF